MSGKDKRSNKKRKDVSKNKDNFIIFVSKENRIRDSTLRDNHVCDDISTIPTTLAKKVTPSVNWFTLIAQNNITQRKNLTHQQKNLFSSGIVREFCSTSERIISSSCNSSLQLLSSEANRKHIASACMRRNRNPGQPTIFSRSLTTFLHVTV